MNIPSNDESFRKRVLILKTVDIFQNEHRGRTPTIRELMTLCRISSTSVINYHLKWLIKNGYIEKEPNISRGIDGVTRAGYELIKFYEERSNEHDQLCSAIRSAENTTNRKS